jgi:carbohydrate kinase (thermoresistant glucokinase family)
MNTPSLRLIVMGVAGCGKTTLAQALAERVGLEMVDGDDLHLPQSVEKMRAGIPLQDSDRWPWLDRIGAHLAQAQAHGRVVACSALKRAYRDQLRAVAPDLRLVYLQGPAPLLAERLAARRDHYMPASMLPSQLAALESPGSDEGAIAVDVAQSPEAIVQAVCRQLRKPTP